MLVPLLLTSLVSLAVAENAGGNPQGPPKDIRDGGVPPFQGVIGNTTDHEIGGPRALLPWNDTGTEHDLMIMGSGLGAQIRLLQLEKALLTNLLEGAMVVQVLKGVNISTASLEAILDDMHTVLVEVRAVNASANDTVQQFIELKNESRELTKEFRETLHAVVTNGTIQVIKNRLRDLSSLSNDELHNCTMRIHLKVRQFNAIQLYRLYGIIGETNTTLINAYINGDLSLNQTKLQVHKIVNQLTRAEQQQIFSQMKDDDIRRKVQSHASLDEYRQHHDMVDRGRSVNGNE